MKILKRLWLNGTEQNYHRHTRSDLVLGRLKEVPGVFSQGKTLEELEDNIRDAYKLITNKNCEESQFSLKGRFWNGPRITKEAIDKAIYGTKN